MKVAFQNLALAIMTSALMALTYNGHAQGTAFTYQGRLNDGTGVATGAYDLRFTVFDSLSGGGIVGGPVTNSATLVSNGLFTVPLDFGAGVFTGAGRWLEIAVRTNSPSPGAFSILSPRQSLLPAPYAMFAANVNASGISGTISSASLAPGAAASNLQASGQSIVPSGGMILSSNSHDASLTAAGYVRLATSQLGDVWEETPVDPSLGGRNSHTAVWTGTEMIIWGGYSGIGSSNFNNGSRYHPDSNNWTSLPLVGAPIGRQKHTAVWTGSEMIVWGGTDSVNYFNDGARYNPAANTWTPVATNGAPTVRAGHTAVWTGTEMLVWGGGNGSTNPLDGGRYNPVSNTWSPITTNGAPAGRNFHSAVWTGNSMIVWGGITNGFAAVNTGGRYYPALNTWSNVAAAPILRAIHTAFWSGGEMFVWGGLSGIGFGFGTYGDGARYNLASNTWTSIPTNSVIPPRALYTAVWTGTDLIVWSGFSTKNLNDGASYNPTAANPWTPISSKGAPIPRQAATAVWTGSKMIVWGGQSDSGFANDGGTYTPSKTLYLYLRP